MKTSTLRVALPFSLLLAGCYVAGDGQLAGGTFGPGGTGAPEDPFAGDDGGDDDGSTAFDPDSIEEPVAADDVVLLEETECFSSMMISDDLVTITAWYSCDPLNLGIEAGHILVGTMNGGYLREVEDIDYYADYLVATTSQARLEDVILNGGFSHSQVFDEGARETLDYSGTTLWSNGAASISLSKASVNIVPSMDLDADFGWFKLNWARARMDLDVDAEIELQAQLAAGTEVNEKVHLGSTTFPFSFPAGPVPVTGYVKVDLAAGIEASANGEITATVGMTANADVDLEGRWDGEWHYTSDRDWDASRTGPDIEAQGDLSVKVYLEPTATIMLYRVAGPGFTVAPFLRGEANAECWDLDWAFHGGADSSVSMNLDLYAWELSHEFGPWTFETELGSGTITLPFPLGTNCDDPPDVDPGDDDDDDDGGDGGGSDPPEATVGECTPAATIACGQSILGDTSTDPAATTAMGAYPINVGNYDAPELVYTWTATQSSEVEFGFVSARPTQVNHDIIVIESTGNSCNSADAVEWGFNAVTFEPTAGTTYQIVVDGYDGDMGAFELALDCNP